MNRFECSQLQVDSIARHNIAYIRIHRFDVNQTSTVYASAVTSTTSRDKRDSGTIVNE